MNSKLSIILVIYCLLITTVLSQGRTGKVATTKSPVGKSDDELSQPLFKNGKYGNPFFTYHYIGMMDTVRWKLGYKDNTSLPANREELDRVLPVHRPDMKLLASTPKSGVQVTWVGHATVLVQMDGLTFITDPMFSERGSPMSWMGPKRFRPVPFQIDEIPRLDVVLISHSHYDHLDYNSVIALNKKFGSKLQWFAPLGLGSWLRDQGCKNVTELTWWQSYRQNGFEFALTPAQHASQRTATDIDTTLWGGWVVIGPRYRFYFAGDTGYCDVFTQIGRKYGPFDLAAIPIGAYEPRWYMGPDHVDPAEAVKIHQDVSSKKSIAVHWGTFALASEYYLEPPVKLAEALKAAGLPADCFVTLEFGKVTRIVN